MGRAHESAVCSGCPRTHLQVPDGGHVLVHLRRHRRRRLRDARQHALTKPQMQQNKKGDTSHVLTEMRRGQEGSDEILVGLGYK